MPLILGANSVSGYTVKNSLRFNSGSSDNLTRTEASGSRRKFTFSVWCKKSSNGSDALMIYNSALDENNQFYIEFEGSGDSNDIRIRQLASASVNTLLRTSATFRDVSAWYHLVVAVDSEQATASNRVRLYINGSEVTAFSTATYPSQNTDMQFNVSSSYTHHIGKRNNNSAYYAGYMSDIYLIDGTQLTPSSFGETDTLSGIWIPKAYTGTYGTNGFNLQFKNSGSLGTDSSGNGNTFTVNNLTSIDQTTDTPTNNFATGNPLNVPTSNLPTFSDGNNTVAIASASRVGLMSTLGITQGKWYSEFKLTATSSVNATIGITGESSELCRDNNFGGQSASNGVSYTADGTLYDDGATSVSWGSSFAINDIIGVAVDLDNSYIYFSKNGTFQNSGVPTSGATGTGGVSLTSVASVVEGTYFFNTGCTSIANTNTISANFGNPPYSANSYTDGAGYGNFSYAVPSGYYSLNTKNLATFG